MILLQLLATLEVYIPRLLSPLVLWLNPVLGVIAIVYVDWVDLRILKGLGLSILNYVEIDKLMDLSNYLLMAIFAQQFFPSEIVNVLWILLLYRVIGVSLFFITKDRHFFLYFAAIFQSFFSLYAIFGNRFDSRLIFGASVIFHFTLEYFYHVGATRTDIEELDRQPMSKFLLLLQRVFGKS